MHNSIRKSAIAFAALGALGALGACNTVNGMGQDVQAGGHAVAQAATETQADMQTPKPMADSGYVGEGMASETRIDIAHARVAALTARPGDVTSQMLQRHDGGSGLRYAFDIRSDGVTYQVGVDAANGAILQNERQS